jgi:flavin-dependent dehydrogenase
MPVRATKRGAERTPLKGDWDVVVCGASFGGLAVARELSRTPARVLVLDRYQIGERQTSACGIPTQWLDALGLRGALQQTFPEIVVHTPHGTTRWKLPWTFSTFDYRTLCRLLWEQSGDAVFETAKVGGRDGDVVHTDRGEVRAPLIVDALGWRRVLSRSSNVQPPEAYLSRGLEVHPNGAGDELELWLDRSYVPAGYSWSFPADSELRVGVGSFDPRYHVKDPTLRLADDLDVPPVRFQGNWIPHRIRPAAEDGVFFVGDSAGHCLPTTAEGIRTALYFGLACGRELRAVIEGRRTQAEALDRYGEFSRAHAWKFNALLGVQWLVPRVPPRALHAFVRLVSVPPVTRWIFAKYLNIAPPSYAAASPAPRRRTAAQGAEAAEGDHPGLVTHPPRRRSVGTGRSATSAVST